MPLYRYLRDGYMKLFGEEEDFNVEYPCAEVLVWEYELGGTAREEFEAALGVSDVSDADDAEDGV